MTTKNLKVCAKTQEKKSYQLDSKDRNPYFFFFLRKKKNPAQKIIFRPTLANIKQSFCRGKETACQQYKAYGVFSLMIPSVTKIKTGTFTGEFNGLHYALHQRHSQDAQNICHLLTRSSDFYLPPPNNFATVASQNYRQQYL